MYLHRLLLLQKITKKAMTDIRELHWPNKIKPEMNVMGWRSIMIFKKVHSWTCCTQRDVTQVLFI